MALETIGLYEENRNNHRTLFPETLQSIQLRLKTQYLKGLTEAEKLQYYVRNYGGKN